MSVFFSIPLSHFPLQTRPSCQYISPYPWRQSFSKLPMYLEPFFQRYVPLPFFLSFMYSPSYESPFIICHTPLPCRMPDKNWPRQLDPFSQQYSPYPSGLSDSYLPMQMSPLANISKPSSCFSLYQLSPPIKISPMLFLVMHSPDSQTLRREWVISKPLRVRLLGLSAAWVVNRLVVPLSYLDWDDVLNQPQVNLPTQSASAVLRMPSPCLSPFLNSPKYNYFSSISSPQSFWSSLKWPSQHLPLKQCRIPSSFFPYCILPKNTQFLYFLSVYGLWTCTCCSCRNIFWQLPQQCMNCSCDHSEVGLSALQLPKFTLRSRQPSIFSFMLYNESYNDNLYELVLSSLSTIQKCSQNRLRLYTITELCLWKWRTKVLKLFCSRETLSDWLRIHLLPWLLPRKRAPSCYVVSVGPYRLKDFSFSLLPWLREGKKLALGTRSSFISTLLSFSLNSACLSAASLTKLLLNMLFPLSTPLLLEFVRIYGNLGALFMGYSFLGGVLCCLCCSTFALFSYAA